MKQKEPRLVWVILVALSVLTAAALTSALATAQEETGQEEADSQPTTAPAEAVQPDSQPSSQPTSDIDTTATLGRDLFNAQCARCHGEDGSAGTPDGQSMGLSAFGPTLDAEHARAVIVGGCGAMVGYTDLTDEQLSALVSHTMSLASE